MQKESMMDLQLQRMKAWNENILRTLTPDKGKSMTSDVVRLIFYMCEKFRVTDLVRYHAIEIHDRFMEALNKDVANITRDFSEARRKDYEEYLISKFALRVATCIQLASKTVGRVAAVTSKEIRSVLFRMGFDENCDSILRSELKVLKLISHNLNVLTPLEVVEFVLMLVGLEKSEYRKLYSLCVAIIDVVYLLKFDMYHCYRKKAAREKPHIVNLTDFHRKENDYFLLAGAITQCAMIIQCCNTSETNLKLSMLGSLTGIDVQEIASLSQCIANFLIDRPV
ncbi:unnamed protein product [Allacma fusca]|uniref:Cyclin N-terminal domain-containing protein n=1 Tax=Allacma fusca TaxID=39272 RepID=A0A8J2JEN4_9HEXA|nr:unnamed protein product [Allacma fusca]